MDVLVGIAIGVVLIFVAVAGIVPALKTGKQAAQTQDVTWLATGLLGNVKTWADGNWNNVLALATGTANQYFLITSSSPYVATSGIESIQVSTSTYFRYFYLSDVYRTEGSIVLSGGTYDPSTKEVTVMYGWNGVPTSSVSEYLTRNRANIYDQSDWSGGPNPNGIATSANSQFSSSTNINFMNASGSISVTLP